MQKITQQHTISLNNGSMIQEYPELEFSDQMRRSHSESSDDYGGDLSPEKLRYLGVGNFPQKYRPGAKAQDFSETREDAFKKQFYSNHLSRNQQQHLTKGDTGPYHRRRKKKSQSFKQAEPSNINSFLNQDSIPNKSHQSGQQDLSQKNDQRKKNNRNVLSQVLKQKSTSRTKQFIHNEERNANMLKKQKQIQRKNNKIREYFRRNPYTKIDYNYERKTKTPVQPQSSIQLITLPEPEQVPTNYHVQRNQNKRYSLVNFNFPSLSEDDLRQEQMTRLRFEQVKINFLDNFLPQSMKIGNNSYNFWKYANFKRTNLFRML